MLAFLDPNPFTLLVLGLLAVLLFGERLPEVASSFGKRLIDLKKGMRNIQDEIRGAIDSAANTSSSTSESHYDPPTYAAPEIVEEATAPKFEPPPARRDPPPSV